MAKGAGAGSQRVPVHSARHPSGEHHASVGGPLHVEVVLVASPGVLAVQGGPRRDCPLDGCTPRTPPPRMCTQCRHPSPAHFLSEFTGSGHTGTTLCKLATPERARSAIVRGWVCGCGEEVRRNGTGRQGKGWGEGGRGGKKELTRVAIRREIHEVEPLKRVDCHLRRIKIVRERSKVICLCASAQ